MAFRFTSLALALAVFSLVACGDGDGDKSKAPAGGAEAGAKAAGGGTPAAAKYDASKGTASLKGTVKFKGTPPKQVFQPMEGTQGCTEHGQVVIEKIQCNGDGTLPHVFVYAVEGPSVGLSGYEAKDIEVDQKGCTYVPHVFGIVAGAKVNFKNTDKISHNVHVKGKKNPEWNKTQSAGGTDPYTPVKELGIKVTCDVHSWMSSYMHCMEHPFFATSAMADGTYEIKGLYPGKYKFKAWHENWAKDKPVEFEVELKDGEATTKDLEIEIK